MEEYTKVKDITYLEYCDYLQEKYGIGLTDYMTKSFNKIPGCTRTKEGLFAHHKMEYKGILLSTKEHAIQYPFEYHKKENIVYCDWLEHLFLHVLIVKDTAGKKGFGGIVCYLVPELNDLYSGWKPQQIWRKNCYAKICNDKDVYLAILKHFLDDYKMINPQFADCLVNDFLCYSSNGRNDGLWNGENNKKLYNKIRQLTSQ